MKPDQIRNKIFMKQTIFILLLSLMIAGCNKQETVITGQLISVSDIKTLVYSVPISETNYWGFSDTLKLDENGNFELKLNITQPAFMTIWNPKPYKSVKLLIEPGNKYHIRMDIENDVQISGANEKGQMLYTSLPSPFYIEMEAKGLIKDTSLTSIYNQIVDLKQNDLSKFKGLLDRKEISKSFFDLIQIDRDCYYASLEARISLIKAYKPFGQGTLEEGNVMLENLKKIYTQYPPNDDRFIISSFWPEYTNHYIIDYQQFVQKFFDLQKLQDLNASGTVATYMIHESKKYLTGQMLEFFQATYIYFRSVEYDYEKELISLFEQFEKDYPQSGYSKYIKPQIDKIIDYYKVIEKPFDNTMVFMEHYETMNTLDEVIKPLLGKKIYVDVWATWCGPCREEFKNNENLKKILAENDIQQLYISIDREERDQKWKDAIKYYNLTGTHVRANKELYNNLMKQFDKKAATPYISIPWYILIDEKGNNLEEHAKSPSKLVSGESLFKND